MSSEGASILVVDDEAVVRRVLGDALAQAGHQVRVAAGGEEALAAMAAAPADLVLLDLQLGDSDGVEVMRQIRERWRQTEVIILTAHGSLASAIAAVRSDAADYLLKPIGVEALRARVSEVLQQRRASRERQERIRTMYQQLQALAADEGLLPAPARAGDGGGEGVLAAGPLSVDVQRHQVRMGGAMVEVTPTEFAILHALVRAAGGVVPCVQVVRTFQGSVDDEDEARQMLRPHIVRLRRKIEPDPGHPRYIQSVRGVGYRWNSSGEAGGEE